ncbi:MAG: hypothetical protein PVI90_02225 [Desulfobacteraceae bacterium]
MNVADAKTIVDEKSVTETDTIVDEKTVAVRKLLKNEPIKHKLGPTGEYEVSTKLIANRRTWRAVCHVCHNGLEILEFPPKITDHTQQMRSQKDITEEQQTKFAQEAVNTHFTRCEEIKNHITLQSQGNRFQPNLKKFFLFIFIPLLLMLFGYWLLFSKKSLFPSRLGPNGPMTILYKCTPAKWCSIALPQVDPWFETSDIKIKVIKESKLPSWLSLDPKNLQFNGQVPPDERHQTYDFMLHAEDGDATENLLRIKLIIDAPDRNPPVTADTPPEKINNANGIDGDYIRKYLEGN